MLIKEVGIELGFFHSIELSLIIYKLCSLFYCSWKYAYLLI